MQERSKIEAIQKELDEAVLVVIRKAQTLKLLQPESCDLKLGT